MSPLLEATRLSVLVALGCAFLTLPAALGSATLLYRSRWRFLEFALLLPLFVPPTVTGFGLLWLLSPRHALGMGLESWGMRVVFTPWGTVLACVAVTFPLAYQCCIVGLSRLPRELTESGLVLGGTPFFTTFRVVWPQLGPALTVAALLVVARALGEFGASMLVGGNIQGETQTLPLLVYSLAETGRFLSAGLAAGVSVALGGIVYGLLRALEGRPGK